jgi:hypothetical protein
VYSLAVDDLFFKASPVPLRRAPKIDYHRQTTAVTRKNFGVETYDTPALLGRGWGHVNIMQRATGKIPLE